ncbi:hypothetical protein ACWGQ5_06420 [Streptomyces sp. NPDC055722]
MRASRPGHRTGRGDLDLLHLPSAGAVRVSLGLSSQPGDVATFVRFVDESYRDRAPGAAGLTARQGC